MTNFSLITLKALHKQSNFNDAVRKSFAIQDDINNRTGKAIVCLGLGLFCLGVSNLLIIKDNYESNEATIEAEKAELRNYDRICELDNKIKEIGYKSEVAVEDVEKAEVRNRDKICELEHRINQLEGQLERKPDEECEEIQEA